VTRRGDASRRLIGVLSAIVVAICLTGCQVVLTTTINVSDNGSGSITVAAVADAETVRIAPELVDAINVDDLRAAGWVVDIQNPSADGGISVVAKRDFANTDEATFFLTQLSGKSGPIRDTQLSRTGGTNDATYAFTANSGLPNGLSGFADEEALAVLGSIPFDAYLARSGRSLSDALKVSVQVTTPGRIMETNGEVIPQSNDDRISTSTWSVPVDGSELLLTTTTRDRDMSAVIATIASRILLVVIIVFAAAAVLYLATVIQRRSHSTPAP